MNYLKMQGLTFAQMEKHLEEANILLTTPIHFDPQVVIRGLDGDYGIAAVQLVEGKLCFDMGQRVKP